MSEENLSSREILAAEFAKTLSPAINMSAPFAIQMLARLLEATESVGPFKIEQRVHKVRGDYSWVGDVRSCYQKRNGLWRIVSENDQGLNHIFGPTDLEAI